MKITLPNPIKAIHWSLALLVGVFSAAASEIKVQNRSSDNVKLYSSQGRGWIYEGTIAANSRIQYFQTDPGDEWGFSDPHTSRVDIIKRISVKNWGTNTLILNDSDLGHGGGGIGGGGGLIQKSITINNYSKEPVAVYANHGSGWHLEDTVGAGDARKYPTQNGDDWGIDDPFKRGTNIIKSLNVKSWDPLPGLTISNAELGIREQPLQKTMSVTNDSHESLKLYLDEGRGYKYVATIRAHASDSFTAQVGDVWCFDDPHRSGVNPVKTATVKPFGRNSLFVDEHDVHDNHGGGRGGGIAPPPREVSIFFKNQSLNKGNIYRKTGPFSKTYMTTVGPWGGKTLNLKPGENIIIARPGSSRGLRVTVPNSNQTIPFRP